MILNKRGFSGVVTGVLMVLLVIAAISTIWAVLSLSIKEKSEGIGTDCFTVNLEPTKCEVYGACSYYAGRGYYEADVVAKRNAGGGDLRGIRFVFEALDRRTFVEDKDTPSLEVLGTAGFERIGNVNNRIRIAQGLDPEKLYFAPIVSNNRDVCKSFSEPIGCVKITQYPTQNFVPGSNQYADNCCQYPWNLSTCEPDCNIANSPQSCALFSWCTWNLNGLNCINTVSPLSNNKVYCCNSQPQGSSYQGNPPHCYESAVANMQNNPTNVPCNFVPSP